MQRAQIIPRGRDFFSSSHHINCVKSYAPKRDSSRVSRPHFRHLAFRLHATVRDCEFEFLFVRGRTRAVCLRNFTSSTMSYKSPDAGNSESKRELG